MDAKPLMPTLVLLHGFLGSSRDWDEFRPFLDPHFRLLTPDLPGHGQSPLPCSQPDFDGVCDALERYLAEHEVSQFHLLGYSLGGRLALHLAKRLQAKQSPESHQSKRLLSLTLESCHPGLADESARNERLGTDELWAKRLASEPLSQFLDHWYQQGVFAHLDPVSRARLIEKRRQDHPDTQRNQLVALYRATSLGRQQDLWQLPALLSFPVNFVYGEHDLKFAAIAHGWQQQAPVQNHCIRGAGHNCHAEQPGALAALLLALIDGTQS
ncbi:2-succinyl-6-hydroxy-2,4-cyclohexadiene-1-carboxylate synthase [Shewanella sp.]|uniref:2-succinyl-6-hydroxy-2, 4-cyclohexadiene-1-carboxylate synthase n=1 Tax=Shewanella sp. TaxID=50422 RepID=UPI00356B43A4